MNSSVVVVTAQLAWMKPHVTKFTRWRGGGGGGGGGEKPKK